VPTLLDAFLPYLETRFADDGCRNAALLTREIKAQGYSGSVRTVMRRIRTWKRDAAHDLPTDASTRPVQWPAPRALAWKPLQDDGDDPVVGQAVESGPREAPPPPSSLSGLHALRAKNLDAWNAWRHKVGRSTYSELKRFLRGLERDDTAVTNAILFPYSNGSTEGQVHRNELIKRAMYGRASFHLLRKKILHHAI
jgi:transposase